MKAVLLFLMCLSPLFAGFHPTINGARQTLPYIETDLPYMLGISVPPPGSVNIQIKQGEVIWQGTAEGTFDIQSITSYEPVLFYEDCLLQYEIIPEPCSLLLLSMGLILLNSVRKRQ